MQNIMVNEIFLSIQGESSFVGWPCVFVRTTGCPLRCSWCDTRYAYSEGELLALNGIIDEVLSYQIQHVEITGGEPLAQRAVFDLMTSLCEAGKTVLLETNGHIDISDVDDRVHVIMDIKCPDSGMADRMRMDNIQHLKVKDEVKFVLASRRDYEYARGIIAEHRLAEQCGTVLLSNVFCSISPKDVVEWMLADRLPVRFQLQMHKFIWDPNTRGV